MDYLPTDLGRRANKAEAEFTKNKVAGICNLCGRAIRRRKPLRYSDHLNLCSLCEAKTIEAIKDIWAAGDWTSD